MAVSSETPLTLIALKWLFATVNSEVRLEVSVLCEGLAAGWAPERFYSLMSP